MSLVLSMVLFVLGVLSWTFIEYALHNWAGHLPKGRHRVSREHLDHHRDPNYFTSGPKKMVLAVPVIGGAATLAVLVTGSVVGLAFAAGIGAGWMLYEYVHRSLHVRAPRSAYGRWARRHHFHHHFTSPRMNHGVTTPLWDIVFKTYERPAVVRVPRKQAHKLPWLVEREADDALVIAAPFAVDYELSGRKVTKVAPQPPR